MQKRKKNEENLRKGKNTWENNFKKDHSFLKKKDRKVLKRKKLQILYENCNKIFLKNL